MYYVFIVSFKASCKRLSSVGHLASVTSADLHARLVAMVTKVKDDLVLTWLGGIMKVNVHVSSGERTVKITPQ